MSHRKIIADCAPDLWARAEQRHRAAAFQDAGARMSMLLPPQGFGVRQPYAAFSARMIHCSLTHHASRVTCRGLPSGLRIRKEFPHA